MQLKRKHAIHLKCNESKFTHSKALVQSLPVKNVFEITLQKILLHNDRASTCSDVPSVFANRFINPSHR